jgi:hypothetical protein
MEGGLGGMGASAGQAVTCDPNAETIIPECYSFAPSNFAPYPVPVAAGLGVSPVAWGFHVIASKRESNTVGIDWAGSSLGASWVKMGCFDAVPAPTRAAGTTLSDGNAEVFVLAKCGQVYGRRVARGWWTAWTTIALPTPTSAASDVALSIAPDRVNCLYVADSGSVFMRCRLDAADNPYAEFGAWHEVAAGAGTLVAAGTRADGRQQAFTVDAEGHPLTAIQSELALDSAFAGWTDFDSSELPPLVDIEAVSTEQALELYAIDSSGGVWTRKEDGMAFTPWTSWTIEGAHGKFYALAGGAIPGTQGAAFILAAAASDGVYAARRESGTWEDWLPLQ